eukprot:213370-Pyramimonas_sp.AAC.1
MLTWRWSRRLITFEKHRAFDNTSPLEIPKVECPALVFALENPDEVSVEDAPTSIRDAVMPAGKRTKVDPRMLNADGKPLSKQELRKSSRLPMYRNKSV